MMKITERELGTVLAALRLWQASGVFTKKPFMDIATNGDEVIPLNDGEIDLLAERLNLGDPLTDECGHKVNEDCMICIACGQCREDLDENDECPDCLETDC